MTVARTPIGAGDDAASIMSMARFRRVTNSNGEYYVYAWWVDDITHNRANPRVYIMQLRDKKGYYIVRWSLHENDRVAAGPLPTFDEAAQLYFTMRELLASERQ